MRRLLNQELSSVVFYQDIGLKLSNPAHELGCHTFLFHRRFDAAAARFLWLFNLDGVL
jgi:hypothetical protein